MDACCQCQPVAAQALEYICMIWARGKQWVAMLLSAQHPVKEITMTRPVAHFETRGKDPKRLVEFYRELFGWNIEGDNPMGILQIAPGIGGPVEGAGGHIRAADVPGVSIFVPGLDLNGTLRKAGGMGGGAGVQPFGVPG